MTRLFLNAVDRLSQLAAIIAGLMLVSSMLVICQMIFLRYVFRAPTIWQTDFVIFTATAAVFLGAPYVLQTRGHVGVDVIELMFPPRVRHWIGLLGAVFGFLFALAMSVASLIFFHEALVNEWRTSTAAALLLWPALLPVPVGFTLLALQYIAELVRRVEGRDGFGVHP